MLLAEFGVDILLLSDRCRCSVAAGGVAFTALLDEGRVTATTAGLEVEDWDWVRGGSRVADVAGKLSWSTFAAGEVESPLDVFTEGEKTKKQEHINHESKFLKIKSYTVRPFLLSRF